MKRIEIEKTIGCCAMEDPARVREQLERHGISCDDFSNLVVKHIILTAFSLLDRGLPVDLLTVTSEIPDNAFASKAAQVTEIATIGQGLSCSVSYYASILQREKVRSLAEAEVKRLAAEIKQAPNSESLSEIMSNSFKEALKASQPPPELGENERLIIEYIDAIEESGGIAGQLFNTPLPTINARSGGFAFGEMTIIAGPESSGKSILGKQALAKLLLDDKLPSAVFTAEMPYAQWMNRLVCEVGEINFKNFREKRLTHCEAQRLPKTIGRIADSPLHVYDRKRIEFSLPRIASEIRRLAKSGGVKVVLIDYLQKIQTKTKKDLRTDQEIGLVSEMLKDLSVQFGLITIVLSSVSDDGNVRNSREPQFDADNILTLCVKKENRGDRVCIVTDKLIVSKWRDAERGYPVLLEMEGQYCRFRDITGPKS